jgi:hypothetical protein
MAYKGSRGSSFLTRLSILIRSDISLTYDVPIPLSYSNGQCRERSPPSLGGSAKCFRHRVDQSVAEHSKNRKTCQEV